MSDHNPPSPYRVLLVDCQEVVRTGLRELLERSGDFVVVGEADTAAAAVPLILELRPDVTVIEVELHDRPGWTVCKEVREVDESLHFLLLTSVRDEATFLRAVRACSCAYVLKDASNRRILDAIRRTAAGQPVVDPTLTGSLLAQVRGERDEPRALVDLNERERVLLALVADGCTNKEIAARLELAEKTVKNLLSVLFRKLGVDRRAQAAVLASQMLDAGDLGPASRGHLHGPAVRV
ncbi:MAG TPA: response regulator transcription factor [Nocardioidaceae bacterium]|nr:response regulator transcription factor [Nocardioidaceae bacterium]